MNGFASQGGPRAGRQRELPVPLLRRASRRPPAQRAARLRHQRRRVAHYGLFPDWVEDLRLLAGQEVVDDLGRGAEAYLQMWERAVGRAGHALRAAAGPRHPARPRAACGCGRARRRCCAAPGSRAGGPAGPGRGAASPRASTAEAASSACAAPRRGTARSARGPGKRLSAATRRRTRRVAPGVRGRGPHPHRRAARAGALGRRDDRALAGLGERQRLALREAGSVAGCISSTARLPRRIG